MIGVDRHHGHVVFPRFADQLRRRVEPHRLAVDHCRGECRRVVVLQPGGDVDQKREAGRVRLGKTVLAESADLLEHVLGELLRKATGEHAVDGIKSHANK